MERVRGAAGFRGAVPTKSEVGQQLAAPDVGRQLLEIGQLLDQLLLGRLFLPINLLEFADAVLAVAVTPRKLVGQNVEQVGS